MPIEILMPALSPTMTEGNLAKWLKKEGDKVKSGDVIAEIETDKATMEVEAVDEGVIGKIMVPDGTEGVKVNALIALLLEEGEDKKALEGYQAKAAPASSPAKEAPVAASANAPKTAKGEMIGGTNAKVASTAHHADTGATASKPGNRPVPMASHTGSPNGRIFASPLAKRVASQEGVDLGYVKGTGPHGRIVRADVEDAKRTGGGRGGRVTRHPTEFTKLPNNTMRKVIARRLTESKQQVPHFYLSVECELDRLLAVREDLNRAAADEAGKEGKPAYKLSVNDFVIKAVGLALKKVPAANASWTDEAILQYNNVDVSVAVAIDGGLITPIVKNADQKPVIQISGEMKELAARARQGKLAPEEFQGGGFSLSNLGMYGIKNFSAIINPPQGCILAVGTGEERVVARGGQMVIRTMMDVTLSVDHRVVDGAVGAEFMAAFKKTIEAPALLLI